MLGDDSIIEVKIGSSLVKVANTTSNRNLSVGCIIMFGIPYSKVYFFSTDDEKRFLL
jgi:hypothetical protein